MRRNIDLNFFIAQVKEIRIEFDPNVRIEIEASFQDFHNFDHGFLQPLRKTVISKTIAVQIYQTKDTARFQVLRNIFNDLKAAFEIIFKHEANPDKIKTAEIVQWLTNVADVVLDALSSIVRFGIFDPLISNIDTNRLSVRLN